MRKNNIISKLGFFFLIILFLCFQGCENDNRDYVPFVEVDLVLDLQIDLAGLGNLDAATITPNSLGLAELSFSSPNLPSINLGQAVHVLPVVFDKGLEVLIVELIQGAFELGLAC